MKVQYLGAIAVASALSLGMVACGPNSTADPCAGGGATTEEQADPCAADPCAADPCAADPCAADPCAADPCAADPCAGS